MHTKFQPKTQKEKTIEIPGHRRNDNIKVDFRVVYGGVGLIQPAWVRVHWRNLMNEVMNLGF
jgi:hypothetical protein